MSKRTQGKYPSSIGTFELYAFYKYNYKNAVGSKLFGLVLKKINTKITELIFTGFTFTAGRLGKFHVSEKKTVIPTDKDGNLMPYHAFIDYGKTNKLWKEHPEYEGSIRIFYENEHFNGKKVNISWNKMSWNSSKTGIKGIMKYNFVPCRAFKRGLAKYIFAHPDTSYYMFNKTKTPRKSYDK